MVRGNLIEAMGEDDIRRGITVLGALVVVVVANLIVDVAYAFLDPRVRYTYGFRQRSVESRRPITSATMPTIAVQTSSTTPTEMPVDPVNAVPPWLPPGAGGGGAYPARAGSAVPTTKSATAPMTVPIRFMQGPFRPSCCPYPP